MTLQEAITAIDNERAEGRAWSLTSEPNGGGWTVENYNLECLPMTGWDFHHESICENHADLATAIANALSKPKQRD